MGNVGERNRDRIRWPHLDIVTRIPFNAESRLSSLRSERNFPPNFFVRTHFEEIPQLDAKTWRLAINDVAFTIAELKDLGEKTITVTLECAGNGRSKFTRPVEGLRWNLGAFGTADFTGTPLRKVLEKVGLGEILTTDRDKGQLLFVGADRGEIDERKRVNSNPFNYNHGEHYARALALRDIGDIYDDLLLAWAMNGDPLTPEHGYPLRLVVPGWYAMASVKWLREVQLLREEFKGFFQVDRYMYFTNGYARPVQRMKVHSLIGWPEDGVQLDRGPVLVQGGAWSGHGRVRRVEVSTNGGESWLDANVLPSRSRYDRSPWWFEWTAQHGRHVVMARATDEEGHTQEVDPDARWNRRGYANNTSHRVTVTVS